MKIQNLEKTLAGLIIVSSIFFQPVLACFTLLVRTARWTNRVCSHIQ